MTTNQTPVVLYAAKSTKDPKDSTGSQLARIEERIIQLGDREKVGSFHEENVSGYKRSRGPELEAAIDAAISAAEDGESELWVFHSSRVGRGTGKRDEARSVNEVFTHLRRHGVALRSVEDDEFVTNPMLIGFSSSQASKYSEDLSAHVCRGKDEQMEAGLRLGGPVPDGLLRVIERDPATDKITSRRYVRDDARAPIIERMFELSEQRHGDNVVARTLNEEGLRTKRGKSWTRRRVQDALLNPIYAGRVRRQTVHGEKLDDPEVVEGTNIEPLIEPTRYDAITAARAQRDRMKRNDPRRRGGRPTIRFALAKIAVCDRCGESMYSRKSPYKRKDGSHARHYLCANVHGETGLCDAPKVNAEKVDTAIISYLDGLFVNFEEWQDEVARGRASKRDAVNADLKRAQNRLDEAVRREARVRRTWADSEEGSTPRRMAEASFEELAAEREDAKARVERLERTLAAEEALTPTTDDMLDLFNELAGSVRGGDDDSMRELNERLQAQFEAFRIDTMPDGTIGVQPVLHPRPAFDVQEAFANWVVAGQPLPEGDEAERIVREGHVEDPRWVTGQEEIRPPAKALKVALTEMGPQPQP